MRFLIFLVVECFFLASSSTEPVTCGSTIKLKNKATKFHLHSHGIAWGSGSQQQSVTGNGAANDQGSNWVLKEAHSSKSSEREVCEPGIPIECGSVIRLEHVQTGKNLHSHLFRSPLTKNQEVSGFGEAGEGDGGDNWKVMCVSSPEMKYWMRGSPIELVHVDTNKYLTTSSRARFDASNCGQQCPIAGQTEVCCAGGSSAKTGNTVWFTEQGLYYTSKTGEGIIDEDDNEL